MNRDVIFGCAGLLLAASYYQLASAVPQSLLADAVGPQGLPKAYAIVLAILSLVLIVGSVRRPQVAGGEDRAHRGHGRAAGMLAIGVVYVSIVSWLGYVASIAALILATAWYQGGAMTRWVAVVSVCGAVFFWLLFVVLLRVPHPVGALFHF